MNTNDTRLVFGDGDKKFRSKIAFEIIKSNNLCVYFFFFFFRRMNHFRESCNDVSLLKEGKKRYFRVGDTDSIRKGR